MADEKVTTTTTVQPATPASPHVPGTPTPAEFREQLSDMKHDAQVITDALNTSVPEPPATPVVTTVTTQVTDKK